MTEEESKALVGGLLKVYEKVEDQIIREAARQLKGLPIWEQWLREVRGIGRTLAIQLIAHIQPIGNFANVAKLWSYSGLHVKNGRAPRRKRGEQLHQNEQLLMLAAQIGDCFIRTGGPYRELYDRYKARDKKKHPEKVLDADPKTGKARLNAQGGKIYLYTDLHMHRRARRWAVKIFFSHLWQVWRELEGLSAPGPYPIECLGHKTILSPWAFSGAQKPPSKRKRKRAG